MKSITIFTDGSCLGNPGPGAWAMLVKIPGVQYHERAKFEGHSTNNQMELMAALQALVFLQKNYPEESADKQNQIIVNADSNYLVLGMKNWRHSWKKRGWKKSDKKVIENLSYWQKLDELADSFQAKLLWQHVKAHSGIPENERVDGLARDLAESKAEEEYILDRSMA